MLLAARSSRVENQDAIDRCIVNMMADPKEARAGITEVHFLPFNPVEKHTAITYIDDQGDWHRVSKGAPEQIIELCKLKGQASKRAHSIIDSYANRGLRSLGLACQDALRAFLLWKLDNLSKEDKCQITMISTWATGLYLDKINQLLLEDDTALQDRNSEYKSIVREFRAFLSDSKNVLDEATTMKFLESYGRAEC